MLLSTAIPIVIAAIVIVIMSNGIPSSPIIPKIMRKTLDKLGCCVVQAVLVSGSSVCCSKVVAPKWKNKLEVLWL